MATLNLLSTLLRGASGVSRASMNVGTAEDAVIHARRQRCAACPHATRLKPTHIQSLSVLTPMSTCSLCRCNLHLKTKLANESCPAQVWES